MAALHRLAVLAYWRTGVLSAALRPALSAVSARFAVAYILLPCAKNADGELPKVFLNMAEKADWLA